MAKTTLTHNREFLQGFSDPIPVLKERKARKSTMTKRARQALRVTDMTDEKKRMRKDFFMIEEEGSHPRYPFLL
jgi:hypothetical protein